MDGLVAQMKQCWSAPVGAQEAGVQVNLRVNLNQDGTVSGSPTVTSQAATPLEDAAGRAAVRAVLRCGPYKLAAEKYNDWSQIDVTFTADGT
jgi:hypothetical protein